MRPFNREKFLLLLLASIFAYQASVFTFGVWSCTRVMPKTAIKEVCPDLGTRYDQTFSVMIATTLALLTGGAAVNFSQRRSSSSNDSDEPPVRPVIKEGPLDGPPKNKN